MMKAATIIAKDTLNDFKKTTATWRRKPRFASKVTVGNGEIRIAVGTDDAIYGYVDYGTKPHLIRAKTKYGLRFLGRTKRPKPKTTPDVVSSEPGEPGEGWTRKDQVHHPGVKARSFSKWIAKIAEKELRRETKNALARFARRSGYNRK